MPEMPDVNEYQLRCARELGHGAQAIVWGERIGGMGNYLHITRPAAGDIAAYVDVYYVPRDHKIPPSFLRTEPVQDA